MFETSQGTIKPIVNVGIIRGDKLLLVKYKVPPNPDKIGWCIPAPELDFGQLPEQLAQSLVAEFGLRAGQMSLQGVDSIVLPGGWHLIYHFVALVGDRGLQPHENVLEHKWFTSDQIPRPNEFAYGTWEMRVAKSYFGFANQIREERRRLLVG